jgi:hypothetical protein
MDLANRIGLTGLIVAVVAALAAVLVVPEFRCLVGLEDCSPLTCDKYTTSSEENRLIVACNDVTDPGYYWERQNRLGGYFTLGFVEQGHQPACGRSSTANNFGESIYYPPVHAHFDKVFETWKPKEGGIENFDCNTFGAGHPVPTDQQTSACGRFSFVCKQQPPIRK